MILDEGYLLIEKLFNLNSNLKRFKVTGSLN